VVAALRPARLPAFAFVVPDLCHDMHDCSVATGDAWLARVVSPLLRVPRTAVFVLFDEGDTSAGGGGQVPAIAAGSAVARHVRYTRPAGHYGLLRTIEDALGVPPLGASARARPLQGIWR
jgi:acid phosphatase